MADFTSGVKAYIKATATIEVGFPIDLKGNADVCCKYCPFMSQNMRVCYLNKEIVYYPERYIGHKCPLKFQETNKEEL